MKDSAVYIQPPLAHHKKNNPSMNDYFFKQDFSKKEKEINLSLSHVAGNTSGQTELAKGALNQSKGSIVVLNDSNQPNFRIGYTSRDGSKEPSSKKKKFEFPVQVSQDQQKQHIVTKKPSTPSRQILNRSNSRLLLSKNSSPNQKQNAQINQSQNTQNFSNKMTLSKYASSNANISDREKKKDLGTTRRSSTIKMHQTEPKIQTSQREKEERREAMVKWADNLDGQDIRTELRFGDCLGQGSFAKVYEGYDKKNQMEVAIKVIDKRKIKDNETKKKALIEEEIYIFSRMNHPNIAKFIRLLEDVKRVSLGLSDIHSDGVVWPADSEHVRTRFRA